MENEETRLLRRSLKYLSWGLLVLGFVLWIYFSKDELFVLGILGATFAMISVALSMFVSYVSGFVNVKSSRRRILTFFIFPYAAGIVFLFLFSLLLLEDAKKDFKRTMEFLAGIFGFMLVPVSLISLYFIHDNSSIKDGQEGMLKSFYESIGKRFFGASPSGPTVKEGKPECKVPWKRCCNVLRIIYLVFLMPVTAFLIFSYGKYNEGLSLFDVIRSAVIPALEFLAFYKLIFFLIGKLAKIKHSYKYVFLLSIIFLLLLFRLAVFNMYNLFFFLIEESVMLTRMLKNEG